MAEVKIKLGVDGNELTKGLNQARQQVETFGKTSEKAMSGRGSNRAAGISMQIQDIAVQAQMGTSALTIFSQQAPQLLSVFGNFGALAGGFAAIGGAVYTFGQKSSESFRTVLGDAAALNAEIGRLAGSGATLESSLESFSKIRTAQRETLNQVQIRQDGGGMSQAFQELQALFGATESNYDQVKEAELTTVALKKQQVRLQNEIVKASGNEVMLAQLKTAGDDKAVDALDRKLKLEAQIQKIKSFGLDAGAESKLIENATRISDLQKKQQVNTYDIAKNIQDQANAANKILAPYQQFLNYLDQAKQKQDAINASAKASKQTAQTKVESQKNFAQALEDEIKILETKATGDQEAIKQADREIAVKAKAREIQIQLGKNAREAMEIAERMQALQDAAEGKGDKGGRIQGYSAERQGGSAAAKSRAGMRAAESEQRRSQAYSRSFGGLKEFSANQTNPNFARPQTPMLDAAFGPVVNAVQQQTQVIQSLLTVD